MRIDPWSSQQYADYARLREQFGIKEFELERFHLPDPHRLFRRKVVFGHRGFESIDRAIKMKKDWAILTGLMPSGNMHFGHKILIDQVIYYQSIGAEIFVAVADIESFATRGMSFEKGYEVAVNEYVKNYIALGLKPENCQIYFQSKREAVKDLAYTMPKKTNLSEMRAIYGFEDSTNMAHVFAPLVQVGDIMHVQLDKYGSRRPVLVPVGLDQDPHLRLTRGLAQKHRVVNLNFVKSSEFKGLSPEAIKKFESGVDLSEFAQEYLPFTELNLFLKGERENHKKILDHLKNGIENLGYSCGEPNYNYKMLPVKHPPQDIDYAALEERLIEIEQNYGDHVYYTPSSTYHRFMTGLTGGKMSTSQPETSIFLTDDAKTAVKKIKSAKTGGRQSAEEQREKGGNPDDCVVFEMHLYHLIEDDAELEGIHRRCRSGELLCGKCKNIAAQKTEEFLKDLKEKRDAVDEKVLDEYLRDN